MSESQSKAIQPLPTTRRGAFRPAEFGEDHEDWVKELAFECWLKTGRSPTRAAALLAEHLADRERRTGQPTRRVPRETLSSWALRNHWQAKFTQVVADNFPHLSVESAAMAHYDRLEAQRLLANITAGEHNHEDPKILDIRMRAAVELIKAGGVGTYGTITRTAPVVRAVVDHGETNLETMSLQELARLELKVTRDTKTDMEERKR